VAVEQPPIQPEDLPEEIRCLIGPVQHLWLPRQGDTSDVAIVETAGGRFALKRTREEPFHAWLRREARVLEVLRGAHLPVPALHLLVERETPAECWMVTDFLEGKTLRETFLEGTVDRLSALYHYGEVLSRIHALACPTALRDEGPWIDRMLAQARFNLDHYPVDGDAALLAHLIRNKPAVPRETLIHGDFTLDNVLVAGGEVTGVIDWSGGGSGDPRYDLALATRPKPYAFQAAGDLAAFFEGYRGRPLSAADTAYFRGLYEFF
jgi:aminoglycoside phosphotransferase (APT) family kinase protein